MTTLQRPLSPAEAPRVDETDEMVQELVRIDIRIRQEELQNRILTLNAAFEEELKSFFRPDHRDTVFCSPRGQSVITDLQAERDTGIQLATAIFEKRTKENLPKIIEAVQKVREKNAQEAKE